MNDSTKNDSAKSPSAGELVQSRAEVPGNLISDYLYRAPKVSPNLGKSGAPSELVLLLHGFQQSGKSMMDKLASCFPQSSAILAPNGPYPLPERREDGSYRMGFTWYFYNPAKDDYYIDMRVSLDLLVGMITLLGLKNVPKRIVGFSQGGYLAPFAALRLSQVKQVIGIASEALPDELDQAIQVRGLSWPLPFRMDQLHGERDEIVSAQGARASHAALLARGAQGKFVGLAEEAHRLTPAMQAELRSLIDLIS